jgi:hypothetical protein
MIAQCVSTGEDVRDRRAPERGRRAGDECFFRPVPGLANLLCGPRARALGYSLSPSGLQKHPFWLRLCRPVEQAILRVGRVERKHALRTPQVLAALFHPGKRFFDADRIRLHRAAFLPAIPSRAERLSNGAGCRSCGVCRSGSHRFGAGPQRPCSQCQGLSYLLARRRVKRSSDRSRYRVQRRRVLSNRRDKFSLGDKRL